MRRPTVNELKQEIMSLTTDMRRGSDEFWVRIRALLEQKGVRPETAMLAQLHTENTNEWLGIVALPGGRVILFMFDHLHKPVNAGLFAEWEELTDNPTDTRYLAFEGQIRCALDLVAVDP